MADLRVFWLLIALALVCYSLPWLIAPPVSLSMNAYDLAEWSSLHPSVRAASPSLLESALLRLPLVVLAWLIALRSKETGRWVYYAAVVLLVVALLPPLEFFGQSQGDPNYRQQFALAATALLGLLTARVVRRSGGAAVLALIGAGVSLAGVWQASELLAAFGVPLSLGIGGPGLIVCCLALACLRWPQPGRRQEINRAARIEHTTLH